MFRNSGKVSVVTAIFAAFMMLSPSQISAYSYGAWVGMTGAKTVAVNPFYSVSLSAPYAGAVTSKFDYGFSDTADIMVDVSDGWIMPRYDFTGGKSLLIGGLMLGNAPGVQLHGIYDDQSLWAVEYNLAYSTSTWDFSGSDLSAIVAPTLKLGDFGVWVEGDVNTILTKLGFDMGAGIYINAGDNQISIGVNSILGKPNVGAWLWAPFSFK